LAVLAPARFGLLALPHSRLFAVVRLRNTKACGTSPYAHRRQAAAAPLTSDTSPFEILRRRAAQKHKSVRHIAVRSPAAGCRRSLGSPRARSLRTSDSCPIRDSSPSCGSETQKRAAHRRTLIGGRLPPLPWLLTLAPFEILRRRAAQKHKKSVRHIAARFSAAGCRHSLVPVYFANCGVTFISRRRLCAPSTASMIQSM
jgi:hypothetical protein